MSDASNNPDLPIEEGSILRAVINFFEVDKWPFSQIGEHSLSTGFRSDNGHFTCYVQAREKESQFVFYSVCPIKVPEDKRTALVEFITRASYGMIIGNFEMDFSDGEIRYKTSIDVEGSILTLPLIKHVIYPNVMMMDKYLPGIMKVIYGGLTPEIAVEEVEV